MLFYLGQREHIFMKRQDTFLLQPSQFGGQGTAVNRQVIRQLLPVIGDGKGGFPQQCTLLGQIGKQLAADAALGQVMDFPVERAVFLCQHGDKITNQPGMKWTGIGTYRKQVRDIQI